jgi:hypothetical protein
VFSGLINGLILANTKLPPFIVTYAMHEHSARGRFVATAEAIRLKQSVSGLGRHSIAHSPAVLYISPYRDCPAGARPLQDGRISRHRRQPESGAFAASISTHRRFIYSLCAPAALRDCAHKPQHIHAARVALAAR